MATRAKIAPKGGAAGAHNAAMKAEMRTREACESLRFLVFGTDPEFHSREAAFERKCGTKEEVTQLYKVWDQMDEDGSGDVELKEFLSFFSRSKADRLFGMRCVNYLIGKAKDAGGGDAKEVGCTVEDMMRLIWLRATNEDIEQMMFCFHQAEFQKHQVPTPPLLPKRKRRQIMENFPHMDLSSNSKVSFQSLVEVCPSVDEFTLRDLQEQLGPTDVLSATDLLEMLCPKGYRAHEEVKAAQDREGRKLSYISNKYFTGWVLAEEERQGRCSSSAADSHPGSAELS